MSNRRRVLIVGGLAVLVLIVLGWVGLRVYLASTYARSLASNRLTQALGLPVEVEELKVGNQSSTVKFRVTEPASSPGQQPAEILKVDSASANVTLADLMTEHVTPTKLTAEGVSLTLRLDRNGKLLTHLPATSQAGGARMKIPSVTVSQAALRIQQEGHPDFLVSGADLQLTPRNEQVALEGTVKDPRWGTLALKGTFATDTKAGWVELSSDAITLRPDLLRTLPYLPESTWDHLQPTGTSVARLRLDILKGGDFTYDLVLTPAGKADLHLPDLGKDAAATLADVTGMVHVHGDRVDVKDCQGSLAGGTVAVEGDADFQPEPSVVKLRVQARGLNVAQLPPEWGIHFPKDLGGKLRGDANLELRVAANGDVEPRGGGEAVVQFTGLAVGSADATFKLVSNGKSYRFHQITDKPPASGIDKKASSYRNTTHALRKTAVFYRHVRPARIARLNAHQAPTAPKGKGEPTTIDATLNLRDVDIAELLKKLKVALPYKLGGRVTAKVTVTVPLNQANSLRSYKVIGQFTSPEFKVEGLIVKELSAELNYAKGVLTLTALKGKMPRTGAPDAEAGSFLGTASAGIEPRGDLTANLALDRFPLGDAVKALAGPSLDLGGSVSGKGRFQAPLEKIKDFATWNATAAITSDELKAFGRTIRQAAVALTVEQGRARLAESKATVEGLPVALDGSLTLAAPYPFEAHVRTSPSQAADLRKLVPNAPVPLAIEGKLQTAAKVTGTLSPLTYAASGSASATDLKLGISEGNSLDLKWSVDQQHLAVTELTAAAFKGTIGGSADIPFDPARPGKFDVAFKELDSEAVSKSLAGFPLRMTGRVSGQFNGALPAARPGESRTITGNLDLTAPQLTVQGIPAERLTGKVGFANEAANYELEGRTLGGSFELKGRYPFRQAAPEPREPRGTFRLRGVDLQRAAKALKIRSLGDLKGTADLSLDFQNDLREGSGRFDLRGLAWGDQSLADQLTGSVKLKEGTLSIDDFGGVFAGGTLRARTRVELRNPTHNSISVALDRADSQLLLAPFEDAKDAIKGPVSVAFRGRLGPNSSGGGRVELVRGSLFGFAVNDLRIPFEVTMATVANGQLIVREAATQTGQGRLTGELTYNWGLSNRLDGKIQFANVRLQSVLAGAGQTTNLFGNGRVSGRFDVGGSNIRSASDITGTLTAKLNGASVRELPILSIITPFVNFTGLTSPFQSGAVRGRLAGGLFRLERLALSNSTAKLFADGTIALASGRLDLSVVAATTNVGGGLAVIQLLGTRIPNIGPIPVGLLFQISELLSNQTVRLTVTGTVKAPVVRVNAAALLGEEAIRFLLSRYAFGAAGIPSLSPTGD